MPAGVEVVVEDEFATITPEPAVRGATLTALLEVVPGEAIRVDTSGTRKSYVVTAADARAAGLLDEAKPKGKAPAKKAPAKKAPAKAVPAKPVDVPADAAAVAGDDGFNQ